MRSGPLKNTSSRSRNVPAVFVLALSLLAGAPAGAAQDVSEAVRLWKFTFHMESAAYGIQHMSKKLLRSTSQQLETAAQNTVVNNAAARSCYDAADELSDYFQDAAETADAANRKKIRGRYETARADCMRALGADPAEYPLGWPAE